MQTLKKDLAFGVRSLQNHPAFSLTAILTSPPDDRLTGGVGAAGGAIRGDRERQEQTALRTDRSDSRIRRISVPKHLNASFRRIRESDL
jgi:hypothetical protein